MKQGTKGVVKGASAPRDSARPQHAGRNQTQHIQNPTATPSTRPSVFTWQTGTFNLDDVLNDLTLPRVIQCDHAQCGVDRVGRGFDCNQPLLVYSSLVSLKVSAGGLAVNIQDGKSLVETDCRLLVSEDYKGWFAVLGSDMAQKTIPHYRRVAQLSQSDCHTFLIGGSDNVKTLQKVGESISAGRHLCPGDVLKMGVLVGGSKYLHCTDHSDRDVLLPVDGEGTFLVTRYKTKHSNTPVLQIKDIIGKFQFPCNVKLVFGREPVDAGVFTKFMVLEGVSEHTSLLAASILKPRSTLHEIPVGIKNRFRVAVPDVNLSRSAGYARALALCADSGDRFLRDIRLFKKDAKLRPSKNAQNANATKTASKPPISINGVTESSTSVRRELRPAEGQPDVVDKIVKVAGSLNSAKSGSPNSITGVFPGANSGSIGSSTSVKPELTVNGSSVPPSRAARPNAYEEVWSVVSSTRSRSDESRTASFGTQEGIGGQLVTGGGGEDSNAVSTTTNLQPAIEKTETVTNRVENTVESNIEPPKPCKAAIKDKPFFNTSIDVTTKPRQLSSNDRNATPKLDSSMKKKKVSFATTIDVNSARKQNVTTIAVDDSTKKPDHVVDGIDTPEYTYCKFITNERVAPSPPPHRQTSILRSSRVPDSGEDEMGYIVPVLDRKGRVHSMSQKAHVKETRTKNPLAKMMSLPKMIVAEADEVTQESGGETRLLY